MTTEELISTQLHSAKSHALALCLATWPDFGSRSDWEQNGLMGQVMDVEAKRGSPWLSRVEREKVEKLIAEMPRAI